MKILGIDPGTATTGFGVIEVGARGITYLDCGVITTAPEFSMPARLAEIYAGMNELIALHSPDCVAVELLYFATNVTTAMTGAQARGLVLLAAGEHDLPLAEYTPMQVKQAVTGYGKADKRQIQEMVKSLLKLDAIPKPDDAADGLAVAITHAHQRVGAQA